MSVVIVGSALLMGLVGEVHCAGMCGGIAAVTCGGGEGAVVTRRTALVHLGRIGAYALLVADGGPAAHFTQADGRRMPKLPHVSEAQWCRWFDAMEPIASTRFIGRATARVLFLWGHKDQLVPPHLAAELYRSAGDTKEERWYDSGHGLPAVAYLDVIDWLAACIGLAPVPAEERAKFPVSAP